MASKRASVPAKHLFNGFKTQTSSRPHIIKRSLATEATRQGSTATTYDIDSASNPTSLSSTAPNRPVMPVVQAISRPQPFKAQPNPFLQTHQCLLHKFPSFEPTDLITYPDTHLGVPLRKDILHRAVIYEGDNTRQGTASTKWRSEVHGSGRKIRPQKGTGRARLGDKKSPMLRGGGVAFGPKPRDFGTELPLKIYDLAWRTALSYRFRMGQLMIIDGAANINVHRDSQERYMMDLLRYNKMDFEGGRTLFLTMERRESLFSALEAGEMGHHARALDVGDVDVKDLLELGRVVVEKDALDTILEQHESDVDPNSKLRKWRAANGL